MVSVPGISCHEPGPGHDILLGHFIEQLACSINPVTFGIKRQQIIRQVQILFETHFYYRAVNVNPLSYGLRVADRQNSRAGFFQTTVLDPAEDLPQRSTYHISLGIERLEGKKRLLSESSLKATVSFSGEFDQIGVT